MSKESIIEKIQRLMQRTSEKGCSENEVEAAMKIARKMMDTHQIEMADLQMAQKKSYTLDDIVEQVVRTHCKLDRWEKSMMSCVCIMTDTQCYMTHEHKFSDKGKWTKVYKVVYYGERTDVGAAHALYVEMLIVLKSMAKHRLGAKWTQAHWHYLEGFGTGMLHKFHQERRDATTSQTASTSGMILHKSSLIRTYAETKLALTTRKTKPMNKKGDNVSAFSSGYKDGQEYQVTPDRSKKIK